MKVFVTVILLALASSLLLPSITLATKLCPECNKTYSDNYSFCEDCGAKLLVLGWTCPNCGAYVQTGKTKCPVCFTKKPGTEETYLPEPETEKPPVTIPEKPQEETKYSFEEKKDLRKGFMILQRVGVMIDGATSYPLGGVFGYGLLNLGFARMFVGLGGEYIFPHGEIKSYSIYAETRFFFFPKSKISPNAFFDIGISPQKSSSYWVQSNWNIYILASVGGGIEYRFSKHFGLHVDGGWRYFDLNFVGGDGHFNSGIVAGGITYKF